MKSNNNVLEQFLTDSTDITFLELDYATLENNYIRLTEALKKNSTLTKILR